MNEHGGSDDGRARSESPARTGRSPGHAGRRGKGRGWFSKRWIYWKRRYSNPTLRDWVLLATVVALVLAVVGAPLSFRLSGGMLAAVCAAAGVLRLLPDPWWATVRNRGRGFDATVFFSVSIALALLTASIPG